MSTENNDSISGAPEGENAKLMLDLGEQAPPTSSGGGGAMIAGGVFNPNMLDTAGAPGAGDPASSELFAKPKSPFRGQTVFIGAVLVLGIGVVVGMRQLSIAAAKAGEMFTLDFKPEAEDVEAIAKFDRVMRDLELSGRPMQVPLDELTSSPFTFSFHEEPIEIEAGEDMTLAQLREAQRQAALEEQRQAAAEEARQSRIMTALANLKVQSVLGGTTPVARVSGEAVREGDELGIFRAVKISGRTVVLEVDSRYFAIQMGAEPREIHR